MPEVLWTGRLTAPAMALVNANNLLAAITGNARDVGAMKERVRGGYDAEYSDQVDRYDSLGSDVQLRAARLQLDGVEVAGREVLDVGGGTGILSFLALEKGAARVTCGDISQRMLGVAESKARSFGYGPDRITFRWLDAEALPFEPGTFDVALTGMTLGLIPDQRQAVAELARVTRPGGLVCVGAHGPEHYWEAVDASIRTLSKRHVLGYRFEFWPRTDAQVEALLIQAGLRNTTTFHAVWRTDFATGGQLYDFFAAVTAAWWLGAVPPADVPAELARARRYCEEHHVTRITDDIIVGSGRKPD